MCINCAIQDLLSGKEPNANDVPDDPKVIRYIPADPKDREALIEKFLAAVKVTMGNIRKVVKAELDALAAQFDEDTFRFVKVIVESNTGLHRNLTKGTKFAKSGIDWGKLLDSPTLGELDRYNEPAIRSVPGRANIVPFVVPTTGKA